MQVCVTWRLVGCLASFVLVLPVLATAQPSTTSVPPLPIVDLDVYETAARDDIGGPYDRARATPDDAAVVGALATVLHAWEQYDLAAQAYARAQHLAPQAVDWFYLGGLVADRRARRAEAAELFERAYELSPTRPLVALRLADARLAAGDIEGAAQLYRHLVEVPACAPASWYGLGRIYLMQQVDGQARAAFARALELYPAFGAAHYAMAQIQRRARDTEGAAVSLARQRQCLACWPMPEDPWRDRVASLRNDAAVLITRGLASASGGTAADDAEAIRLHEAALAQDPSRSRAHVNLIELYGRTGNAADAARHFAAVRDVPAYAADAHRGYGFVLLSLQQPGEALPHFEEALTKHPDDPLALQGLGLTLEMLDRPADAVHAYTRALRAAPTMRTARFGLARVSMRLNDTDQAITHLERLREPVDAETARYLFALSVAHVRQGNVGEGRRVAEQALTVAQRFGDTPTAATIEAELRKLRRAP